MFFASMKWWHLDMVLHKNIRFTYTEFLSLYAKVYDKSGTSQHSFAAFGTNVDNAWYCLYLLCVFSLALMSDIYETINKLFEASNSGAQKHQLFWMALTTYMCELQKVSQLDDNQRFKQSSEFAISLLKGLNIFDDERWVLIAWFVWLLLCLRHVVRFLKFWLQKHWLYWYSSDSKWSVFVVLFAPQQGIIHN